MTEQTMIDLALAENFAAAVVVDTKDIVFDPIFRPYCEENLCGQYGVNYTCPPDCGTPEEMRLRFPNARVVRAVKKDCALAVMAVAFRAEDVKILCLQPSDDLRAAIVRAVKAH